MIAQAARIAPAERHRSRKMFGTLLPSFNHLRYAKY